MIDSADSSGPLNTVAPVLPPPPAPKRSLRRRIARGIGIGLASIVGLVVLALVFLQTPWGKELVRSRIESRLAGKLNGTVRVGSIDYSFLFGEIHLADVEVRDAADRPALAVAGISVELDRTSLLAGAPVIDQLDIRGLDVAVVQTSDGRSNLTGLVKPSTGKPLERIRIAHLAIAGTATLTKPDGTVIAVRDLAVGGSLDARPAAKELDLALSGLGANVEITAPGAATRELGLGVGAITVGRRVDAIDVDVHRIALGALAIDTLGAHVRLDGRRLHGAQSITLAGVKVDSDELAALLGRELLVEDLAIDATVSGPEDQLAIDGSIRTGGATLALDGTVDLSSPARPRYRLAVVGTGLRSDVVRTSRPLPRVETGVRIELAGAGTALADLDAELAIALGPTTIGAITVDGLTATATARAGAYELTSLRATAPGLELDADGALAADRSVRGTLTVRGVPAEVAKTLAAAGIALPGRVPLPPRLELAVTATGNLDGAIAIDLAPTRLALARGQVTLAGSARLERRVLTSAVTRVGLRRLDLAALADLAGRNTTLGGTLSGTLALHRDGADKRADYDLAVALDAPALTVTVKGSADPTGARADLEAVRASDRAVVATVAARLPLGRTGGKPGLRRDGAWQVDVDVARRSLAELTALLPERLRRTLPAGDAEIHIALAGTPARPTGTIDVALTAAAVAGRTQRVELHGALSASDRGLALATDGSIYLDRDGAAIAILDGTVALPLPFAGGALDLRAVRAGATVDATIDIPDRALASLAFLRPKLAELGGTLAGRIELDGPVALPQIDAKLRLHGYQTATGGAGETTLSARGTPKVLVAELEHAGAIAITAAIDRSTAGRIEIRASARADDAPVLSAIPAFLAGKVGASDPGRLDWAMDGTFALVRGANGLALDQASLTGSLDLTGGAIAIPGSDRRWKDIALQVVSEPTGLRIESLVLHESDLEVKDRRLEVSGRLGWDKLRPRTLELALSAHDWLLFGSPTLGPADAPRAAADFAIDVAVDLAAPVVAVDATVRSLALRAPDRFDRGHQPELASISGDVIYLGPASGPAGKLPVTVIAAAPAPRGKRRPVDVRIHIPTPIRLNQTPFDVMAHGDLAVALRDTGVTTRGVLTMDSGTLNLFGRDHELVDGSLGFTDEHPHGWLALTFERALPPAVLRELGQTDTAGGRVTFAGPPTKPKTTLGGATNAALAEVMAMNNAGRPVHLSAPDLIASATVEAPRGDQLAVLTFMASNLPHLLFLDRVSAWSASSSGAAYGRIENVEAERYSANQKSRVRAVVRAPTPGRSSAELQWDRMLVNTRRAAFGVGVRAGSRRGGGVGMFVEWSD